jgi:hypothetical protein
MPSTLRSFRRFPGMVFVVCLLSLSSMVGAESLWSGTWVLREPPQGGRLTMTVEEVGTGWNLTYKVVGQAAPGTIVSTVLTQLNCKDVTVLIEGKPSGQTMGIKKIDSRHTVGVVKFQGKEIGISKGEISPMVRSSGSRPITRPRIPSEKRSSTGTGSKDHLVTLRMSNPPRF